MILAIVGGRDYTNFENFKSIVNDYLREIGIPSEIVSGGASGIDTLADRYAKEYFIPIKIFPPNWSLGKKAGLLRNTQIVEYSTHILALPTALSVGTYDTIRKAQQQGKILRMIKLE